MRAHHRIGVELEVTLELEGTRLTGVLRNLSEGGCFVEHAAPPPVRTLINLQLPTETLGAELAPVPCEITWTRLPDPRAPEELPGMGLRFIEPTPQVASRLAAFCAALRKPLFITVTGDALED